MVRQQALFVCGKLCFVREDAQASCVSGTPDPRCLCRDMGSANDLRLSVIPALTNVVNAGHSSIDQQLHMSFVNLSDIAPRVPCTQHAHACGQSVGK